MDAATRLTFDPIAAAEAGTLPGLFLRHGEGTLGRRSYAWHDTCSFAARWQTALAVEHLDPGQRVAMLLRDSVEWVCCGQAALRLGLAIGRQLL